MPRIVGTADARNHEPKPISTPKLRAIAVPRGFAAIAVSQSADDRLRLTMPENMRNDPRRRRLSLPGVAPAASASENASGYMTPERAVLLGNAGLITPSTRKMLYERPSVDRPNQLTMRCPIRTPRPHLMIARATRNARTIRRIVAFANPAYAFAGVRRPVSTVAATASTEAVRIGKALTTTDRMAAAKMANTRQASRVKPSGGPANHRITASRTIDARTTFVRLVKAAPLRYENAREGRWHDRARCRLQPVRRTAT